MRILELLAICFLVSIFYTGITLAEVPQLINLQGYLVDDQGPVTGTYEATFRIYDDPDAGNILWEETDSVEVDNGLYSQVLGETVTIDISWEGDRWIGVQFAGHPEMTPRYKQTAVPYTFLSDYSDSSGTVSDDAVTTAKILDGTIQEADLSFIPLTRPLSPGVSTDEIADDAVTSVKILDGSITSAEILDGTIGLSDIGQNGALDGQVMKWDSTSSSWVAADDETGGGGSGGGWVDDGNKVRLETSSDSVGIGTSTPAEKLTVDGNILVTGKGNIGYGNTNSGSVTFVAGFENQATGYMSTVSGGRYNRAWGSYNSIAGGDSNYTASNGSFVGGGHKNYSYYDYSCIVGGYNNDASGDYAFLGGGYRNMVGGSYAAILGGINDTIAYDANYSFLFGINSKLTEDSTMMIDMPHIRFGNETTGYEFPTLDGVSGQVLSTDGNGQLSWVDMGGGEGVGWIDDGTIVRLETIDDSVGIGTSTPSEKLEVAGNLLVNGKANIGSNNTVYGVYSFAAGESCVAYGGYSSVGGGQLNTADDYAVVGGGKQNVAADSAVVSGGYNNSAGTSGVIAGGVNNWGENQSVIGGGIDNRAEGLGGVISGGRQNNADSAYGVVGGGIDNNAVGQYSVISGGRENTNFQYGSIGGGRSNFAGNYGTIGGGMDNSSYPASYGAVGGGYQNEASGDYGVVGGGDQNTAAGSHAVISGGYMNNTGDEYGTVSGGYQNYAWGYSTVGGGKENNAGEDDNDHYCVVGGGFRNTAADNYGAVLGGYDNGADGIMSVIGGGWGNSTSTRWNGVFSGHLNKAGISSGDSLSFIGGGRGNELHGHHGAITGGFFNQIDNSNYGFIGGGYINEIYGGENNTIGGGRSNYLGPGSSGPGSNNVISGGESNKIWGDWCTIGGGYNNEIEVDYQYSSIIGGYNNDVWGDYSVVFGNNVRVSGNYRAIFFDGDNWGYFAINRDDDSTITYPLQIGTDFWDGNGAYLSSGGFWHDAGTLRNAPRSPLVREDLFAKISNLSIDSWENREIGEKHIGPTAEDFVAAFDVGTTRESDGKRENRYLAASDVAGVALAGVQELIKKIEKIEKQNTELIKRNAELENRILKLENSR